MRCIGAQTSSMLTITLLLKKIKTIQNEKNDWKKRVNNERKPGKSDVTQPMEINKQTIRFTAASDAWVSDAHRPQTIGREETEKRLLLTRLVIIRWYIMIVHKSFYFLWRWFFCNRLLVRGSPCFSQALRVRAFIGRNNLYIDYLRSRWAHPSKAYVFTNFKDVIYLVNSFCLPFYENFACICANEPTTMDAKRMMTFVLVRSRSCILYRLISLCACAIDYKYTNQQSACGHLLLSMVECYGKTLWSIASFMLLSLGTVLLFFIRLKQAIHDEMNQLICDAKRRKKTRTHWNQSANVTRISFVTISIFHADNKRQRCPSHHHITGSGLEPVHCMDSLNFTKYLTL